MIKLAGLNNSIAKRLRWFGMVLGCGIYGSRLKVGASATITKLLERRSREHGPMHACEGEKMG